MRPRPFLLLLAGFALVMLAAGGADAKEPLWSYTTGDDVRSVAISADGKYTVAGSFDGKVYLFGKGSSTPLWNYTTGGFVVSVSISADGEYIAAGGSDWKVYLFDKDSSTPLWSYTTGNSVRSVAISADGEYIAAGSDNNVYLFNKNSGTPLWNYTTSDDVMSVAISADGQYIAAGTGYYDKKVYLFDRDSSTPLWNYTTGGSVRSVAISADGEYIAAGYYDNKVYLFHKDSSTPLWNYTTGNPVNSVAISADGEYIVAGASDSKVYLFDKDSSTPLWNYTFNENLTGDGAYSVAISADGEYITAGTGGWVNEVYLFHRDSSTPLWSYTASHDVKSVAISADGKYIAAAGEYYNIDGHKGKVYLFDKDSSTGGSPVATIDSITPSPARFDAEVTFSGTGSDSDGTVVAYEWTSDIDGFLSDEEDFSITGFSVGNHTITFRVQDNDGDWSEWDTAGLEIYPNAPPVGTIDSIEPSPTEKGTAVFFNGTGSDTDGNVVAYLWTSSIDGNWPITLSTDEDFSSNNLSLGHHTITFRVQDNDGAWSNISSESLFVDGGNGTDDGGGSSDDCVCTAEYAPVCGVDGNTYGNSCEAGCQSVEISYEGACENDDGGIPAPSLAAAVAAVAVIALRRRR